MVRRDDGRQTRKHVSWSPVIRAVYRPTSRREPSRVRRQESVVEIDEKQSGFNRTVRGTMIGHARRDTHSLLLTIRRNSHRDVQLLVDLPKREIRRIYDGKQSWNVVNDESAPEMKIACRIDSVTWKDDRKTRSSSARGFDVDWMNGKKTLHVQASTRSHAPRKSVTYRSSKRCRSRRRVSEKHQRSKMRTKSRRR